MKTQTPARFDIDDLIEIAPGTRQDYLRLAPLHYRETGCATGLCAEQNRVLGHPATIVRILTARAKKAVGEHGFDEGPVGVLVVSMPTLNSRWRNIAWPGAFDSSTLGKREAAGRINDGLRTISRVIVDPRWRCMGVATALVKKYLSQPMTWATEAVAVMGRTVGFFEAAGMTAYQIEPSDADRRAASALRDLGLEPWMLVDIAGVLERYQDSARQAEVHRLERVLRVWARSSKRTSSRAGGSLEALVALAAARLSACPIGYAFGEGPKRLSTID